MADKRISELTTLTGANSADDDLLVIVDSSASETKSITLGELEKALGERDFSFADDDKLVFGDGDDLQIYHDGANSYIKEIGTGNLKVLGDNIYLKNADDTETALRYIPSGELRLYYANAEKLATTNTGINVTGTVTADSLTVDTDTLHVDATNNRVGIGTTSPSTILQVEGSTLTAGDADYNVLIRDSATAAQGVGGGILFGGAYTGTTPTGGGFIQTEKSNATDGNFAFDLVLGSRPSGLAPTQRMRLSDNGDISFYEDTGTTAKFFWDSSNESLTLGSSEWPTSAIGESVGRHMINSDGETVLILWDASTGAQGNQAQLLLGGKPTNSATQIAGGRITGVVENASDADGYLSFETTSGVSGFTEKMRIDSSGNVGINTSPQAFAKLQVKTATDRNISVFDNANGATICAINDLGGSTTTRIAGSPIVMTGGGGSGSEHVRIDSSGNVGIGTTSPDAPLTVQGGSATAATIQLKGGALANDNASIHSLYNLYLKADSSESISGRNIVFQVGSTEGMRIDSSGTVCVNCTSASDAESGGIAFVPSGGNADLVIGTTNSGADRLAEFYNPNGRVGGILTNGSATTFETSSDYRLKENWVPMEQSIERVKALNPVNFAWKVDGTRVDGFLAHEAQEVVPEAITGTKDAMTTEEYEVTPAVLDEDGNVVTEAVMGTREVPDYQGIDQSKLVPLLTGALQEAIARIETLEAQVATLQGN